MNTLHYINLADADFATLQPGDVVVAHCADFEGKDIPRKSEWRRVYSKDMYHYELLHAPHGVTPVLDANGDRCGFTVNGSNRRSE